MADTHEVRRFVKFFVSQDSSTSFAFPLLFNEHLPEPLPINVELLHSGTRSWTVGMKRRGDTVSLTLGWEHFVRENNLQDGKLLEFIYDLDRTFSVIVYGLNSCSEHIDLPQVVIDVDDYGIEQDQEDISN